MNKIKLNDLQGLFLATFIAFLIYFIQQSYENDRRKNTLKQTLQLTNIEKTPEELVEITIGKLKRGEIDLENLFECGIHLGELENPVTLNCGHSFCQKCLEQWRDAAVTLNTYRCPACNANYRKINIPKINVYLRDLLSAYNSLKREINKNESETLFESGFAKIKSGFKDEGLLEIIRAKQMGNPKAFNYLGVLKMEEKFVDDIPAVEYFSQAAQRGDKNGYFNLGQLYENGHGGVAKDLERAKFYYLQAAERGDHDARRILREKFLE